MRPMPVDADFAELDFTVDHRHLRVGRADPRRGVGANGVALRSVGSASNTLLRKERKRNETKYCISALAAD
jgi:hypothetical protein